MKTVNKSYNKQYMINKLHFFIYLNKKRNIFIHLFYILFLIFCHISAIHDLENINQYSVQNTRKEHIYVTLKVKLIYSGKMN